MKSCSTSEKPSICLLLSKISWNSTVNCRDDGRSLGDAPLYYRKARFFHIIPSKTVYIPFF